MTIKALTMPRPMVRLRGDALSLAILRAARSSRIDAWVAAGRSGETYDRVISVADVLANAAIVAEAYRAVAS